MRRLAIITTHPIQYYAPIFKLLHERKKINIMVFYTWGKRSKEKFDPGFGRQVDWDIPLTDGYPYVWVKNISKKPGSAHYNGVINPDLIEQITNWQADAILVFGWAYHSHIRAIRHFKGRIPVFFRGDSTLPNQIGVIRNLLKYIALSWVYHYVDYALYVGSNNKKYFKKYGLKENQLIFAPHAIDNERFGFSMTKEANRIRDSLKLKDYDILILYAGKFEYVKNVELLLSAFLKLHKPSVHLLLTGNGPNEQELKQLAAKTTINHSVHFMDFTNQSYMPALYQASDLFCLPSRRETWGLAVNEAMACSKAVLVSDEVGCADDLVTPGYNGAIFESCNENDLIQKLDHMISSRQMLKQYGENSLKIIQDWNFMKIAGTIETTIDETF